MNETWDSDLMDMLKEAKMGNTAIVDDFVAQYHPFAVKQMKGLYLSFGTWNLNFRKMEDVCLMRPENEQMQKGGSPELSKMVVEAKNMYTNDKVYQGTAAEKLLSSTRAAKLYNQHPSDES